MRRISLAYLLRSSFRRARADRQALELQRGQIVYVRPTRQTVFAD